MNFSTIGFRGLDPLDIEGLQHEISKKIAMGRRSVLDLADHAEQKRESQCQLGGFRVAQHTLASLGKFLSIQLPERRAAALNCAVS